MSLNWREIDTILEELQLENALLQGVVQADFRNLFLQFYKPGGAFWVRICLETPWVRMHRSARGPQGKRTHQRFEEALAAHIKGGRIVGVEQVHSDRIVRLAVRHEAAEVQLFIRLWGGAQANVILCDDTNTIIDAFFRKPSQGIASGSRFTPSAPTAPPPRKVVREHAFNSFNEAIEAIYGELESTRDLERERAAAERLLIRRRGRLSARLAELTASDRGSAEAARLRHHADLLLAHAHLRPAADGALEVLDYNADNAPVRIMLDRGETPGQAAARLYTAASKAESGTAERAEAIQNVQFQLEQTERQLEAVPTMASAELRELRRTLEQSDRAAKQEKGETVGLRFQSGSFLILVGRSAAENDALLRRAVRGNDMWMHTRDVAGGYVFIKSQPGKSIPLETLLDAGNLAVFFSKARRAGSADLYYTHVKYLRRAKGATYGTVLPTHEKNLSIRLDPERIRALGIGAGDW